MNTERVKDFITYILEEAQRREMSIGEVNALPHRLEYAIGVNRANSKLSEQPFKVHAEST